MSVLVLCRDRAQFREALLHSTALGYPSRFFVIMQKRWEGLDAS